MGVDISVDNLKKQWITRGRGAYSWWMIRCSCAGILWTTRWIAWGEVWIGEELSTAGADNPGEDLWALWMRSRVSPNSSTFEDISSPTSEKPINKNKAPTGAPTFYHYRHEARIQRGLLDTTYRTRTTYPHYPQPLLPTTTISLLFL